MGGQRCHRQTTTWITEVPVEAITNHKVDQGGGWRGPKYDQDTYLWRAQQLTAFQEPLLHDNAKTIVVKARVSESVELCTGQYLYLTTLHPGAYIATNCDARYLTVPCRLRRERGALKDLGLCKKFEPDKHFKYTHDTWWHQHAAVTRQPATDFTQEQELHHQLLRSRITTHMNYQGQLSLARRHRHHENTPWKEVP